LVGDLVVPVYILSKMCSVLTSSVSLFLVTWLTPEERRESSSYSDKCAAVCRAESGSHRSRCWLAALVVGLSMFHWVTADLCTQRRRCRDGDIISTQ